MNLQKYNTSPPTFSDKETAEDQCDVQGNKKVVNQEWSNFVTSTPDDFAGGTTNARGDFDGTSGTLTLFTVTGDVIVRLLAVCTTTLTIAATATLEVGVSGNTACLIAQTAGDAPDAGEIWHDASPDSGVEASSVLGEKIIVNGADIIETTATANINTGVIKYVCFWQAISSDGNVVAA